MNYREIKPAYTKDDEQIYVYTNSDGVYVGDNESKTLTNKLNEIDGEINKGLQKIEENSAQLSEMPNYFESKRVQCANNTNDSKGAFDSANFAGQNLGVYAPIGNVMHHYTDGIMFQMDNVGEHNPILYLKNAYNPSRRPDKPNTFVGSGDFISCGEANLIDGETQQVGVSKSIFKLDSKGNMTWADKPDKVVFATNKEDDGKTAFQFVAYKKHGALLQIMNAYSGYEITIKHDANNKCVFESGNYATGGVTITSVLGETTIESQQGAVNINTHNKSDRINLHGIPYVWDGTTYSRVITLRSGASAGRPTTNLYAGQFYFDTSLGSNGKPIWYNGINWVDANGVIV